MLLTWNRHKILFAKIQPDTAATGRAGGCPVPVDQAMLFGNSKFITPYQIISELPPPSRAATRQTTHEYVAGAAHNAQHSGRRHTDPTLTVIRAAPPPAPPRRAATNSSNIGRVMFLRGMDVERWSAPPSVASMPLPAFLASWTRAARLTGRDRDRVGPV